jgi:hypothetical protein
MMAKVISDCAQDGCGECDVCTYLDFLEHASMVAPRGESTIEHNAEIEAHLDRAYPHWRS